MRSIYNNLGPKRASALLGFHALTGSDMSGRFAGRTKDSCFKAFMSCDDEVLDALAMLVDDIDLPADLCSQLNALSVARTASHEWKFVDAGFSAATTKLSNQR